MGKGIADTAPAGDYDFQKAFELSCNSYFIEYGLRAGPSAIISMGEKLHFGERTGIPLPQDSKGILPTKDWVRKNRPTAPWRDGDTANLSIGQGDVAITPLQMTAAMAAVANGGRVLAPKLVLWTQGLDELVDPTKRPEVHAEVRENLPVSPRTLEIIQRAMLADTEDEHGTGQAANFRHSGFHVCGKTGTAQLKKGGRVYDHVVWFASYAPYEDPRYAVVVMVQSGGSGGGTCAPIAAKIYRELKYREDGVPAPRRNSFVKVF
jgi:penicillin-binding protein 2